MAVNKVIYYGEVLVDMSQVTVTPETLAAGKTALNAAGELITGTAEQGGAEPVLQSKIVSPATFEQTITPDNGYDGLSDVTVEAMPKAIQATPSIEVDSSGLITAKATQSAGYVESGMKSATKQLATQEAQTITPGTFDQVITSGRYLTGVQTVKGDANLVPENIVSGVSIFGVEGAAETGDGGGDSAGNGQGLCTVNIDALADYPIWTVNINGTNCYPGVENKVLCSTMNTFCIMGVEASGVIFDINYGDYQERWFASPFSTGTSITYGVFEGLEEGAYVTVTLVVE